MYQDLAKETIYQAFTPYGILASSLAVDNYARVWSRDSMMTGIVGLLIHDEQIISSFRTSILTLSSHQSPHGQIPSNVPASSHPTGISYGSLVGRVDATTWWIIGTCLYILHTNDTELKTKLEKKITSAIHTLEYWEYNDRHLIYTPLGGNWADEYLCNGYTLYDNSLRYWAVSLAANVYNQTEWKSKSLQIQSVIQNNYTLTDNNEKKFHPNAYAQLIKQQLPYLPSSFNADGYNTQWDMAANALALLLSLNTNINGISSYLAQLHQDINHWMLPVFYPIIQKDDWKWNLLEKNYNYNFKNEPYHFQNGGSWPIFLGWMTLALRYHGQTDLAQNIKTEYESLIGKHSGNEFREYWNTDELKPNGTNNLCFSASGYLLMNLNEKNTPQTILKYHL